MKKPPHPLIQIAFLIVTTAYSVSGFATPVRWEVGAGGNGHLYEVIPQSLSWTQANIAAQSRGGYLATLTSEAEHAFVLSLLATETGSLNPAYWTPVPDRFFGPWLGAKQADGETNPAQGWSWVTGEPFEFTSWFPGEPNDYNGRPEQFMHLFVRVTDSDIPGWNDSTDIPMYDLRAFVVEYASEPVTASTLVLGLLLMRFSKGRRPLGRPRLT